MEASLMATFAPVPVKPDTILRELSDLWTSTAKSDPAEGTGGTGVLRACSMTLIVFVDDEDDAMALGETLALLMKEHPSRAIVVRLKAGSGELHSRVFAQCWMPFGHNRQICCEQVELTASISRLGDLPPIVAPLDVPDLPRVVWFRSARLATAPDISQILALGDKLIVDSSRPGAPAFADLRSLAAANFVVGDLAWTRITRLRELISRLLSDRELSALQQIAIEHCGTEAGAEAKYLQAWLRNAVPAAVVEFQSVAPTGPGQIRGLKIGDDLDIRVLAACATYEAGPLRQRANLSEGSDHELLAEELSIMKHDLVFEQALRRMTIWTPHC